MTDNTGAAIPGVTVTVTNEGTGLKLDTVTDGEGLYTIRNVLPGTYTLNAALQGFKTFAQTGIPLTAGNILRVNATLEIGALTESITVTTEAALLKTDKADVSVELQPKAITDLPLNQFRNYQALMNLVPGATPGAFQNSTGLDAAALAAHVRQRHQPEQQQHPHRRRGQHQHLAAAPRRHGGLGRDDRQRQHRHQQLRCRHGHGRRRGDCGRDQVGHQQPARARRSSSTTATTGTPTRSSTTPTS